MEDSAGIGSKLIVEYSVSGRLPRENIKSAKINGTQFQRKPLLSGSLPARSSQGESDRAGVSTRLMAPIVFFKLLFAESHLLLGGQYFWCLGFDWRRGFGIVWRLDA